jgi:DNA-binding NarL/FixJ family response regulator
MGVRMVRVLLVDDHQLVRAGLRRLLADMPGVEVVGEAGDAAEALHLVARHRPDVVLLDISLPGLSGLEVLREVRAGYRPTKVMMLSMNDEAASVTESFRLGAAGYLVKHAAVEELERALAALARGETYLSPSISHHLAQAIANPAPKSHESELTVRQQDVLRLVAMGHSSQEIARALGLSVKTVGAHRVQIMNRLAIRDLAGLVRYAVRNGLVSSDE